MTEQDLRALLERIPDLHHACDLDLLLFFYRHPRALLTSERLMSYLGHDRERVARSLERLIESGLLTRSQNPSNTARLYVLELEALPGGLLSTFLKFAATRQGRLDVLRHLGGGTDGTPIARLRRRARLTEVS